MTEKEVKLQSTVPSDLRVLRHWRLLETQLVGGDGYFCHRYGEDVAPSHVLVGKNEGFFTVPSLESNAPGQIEDLCRSSGAS